MRPWAMARVISGRIARVGAASGRRVALLGAVLLVPMGAATADSAPLAIVEALCADDPSAPIDARGLVRHLLEVEPVPDAVLDANGDGDTLFDEKRRAILDPTWCAQPGIDCASSTAQALAAQRQALADLIADPRIRIERLRAPDQDERAIDPSLQPTLAVPDGVKPGELLDPDGRFVRLACADQPPSAVSFDEAELPPPAWVRDPDHDEGFRLTSEIDDLSKRREELGTVKPAEFSVSSNLLQDETTFFVDAVAGYHFDVGRGDRVRLLTVPFALVQRLFSDARDDVDKVGIGWQLSGRTPLGSVAQQELALTPVYFTDSALEADIGTLKLRWTPLLDSATGVPLGNVQRVGDLALSTGIDLLTDAGQVFDSGDNEDLLSEESFLRVGGRLRLSVRGTPGTLFEQIQFDLSEKYLYNIGSDIEHINLVEVAFSYLFPNMENYRLTFSFTGGRDDDTLVEKAFWKSQVGVRF